jgi:hypothetical protein
VLRRIAHIKIPERAADVDDARYTAGEIHLESGGQPRLVSRDFADVRHRRAGITGIDGRTSWKMYVVLAPLAAIRGLLIRTRVKPAQCETHPLRRISGTLCALDAVGGASGRFDSVTAFDDFSYSSVIKP